ncbi:MAG: M1 family metallopeptidase [Clostridiales bacterium]|nr:M1 family metallopeptidase [Clostridiales bacterium]
MKQIRKSPKAYLLIGAALLIAAAAVLAVILWPANATLSEPSAALSEAMDGLDESKIEAVFGPSERTLEVTQQLMLTNRTGQDLTTAVLRTWPNAFQNEETSPCASEELAAQCYPDGFSIGALVMEQAQLTLGGETKDVPYYYIDDAKTALCLPLGGTWRSGEILEATIRYTVRIPHAAYRFGENNGIFAIGNCFAVPAVMEDGEPRLDEYLAVGDPAIGDVMNYHVSISVPLGYECAGSGYPEIAKADGNAVYHYDSPAIREFALVISDGFETAQTKENEVCITAYAKDSKKAKDMLKYAKQALACYSERYGAYPYQSFTLAEIDFPMGGMEYSQLVMIGSSQIERGGDTLEQVVAHEAAHQWWYGVVGSDSYYQSWQDEALCEFSVLDYVETYHGASGRAQKQEEMDYAMRVTVPRGITPGAPLDYFSSMSEYSLVVYNRGGAMLAALNQAMGCALDDFLKVYYDRYAFSKATREDFEMLLAEYTGEDYSPLITDYLDTHILN